MLSMAIDDDDRAELLERRLTEKVTGSVESALKRRYAWIVALFLGLYGLGGWALVNNLIQSEIAGLVEKKVKPAVDGAERVSVTAQVAQQELEKLQEAAKRAVEDVQTLNEQTGELSRRIEAQIATTNDQVASLGLRLRTAEDVAQRFDKAREELEALRQSVATLNAATEELASRANVAIPEKPAPPLIASAPSDRPPENKTTVYFQYSGRLSGDEVKAITADLGRKNFSVPGVERSPSTVQEVRYFYPEDAEEAKRLAQDVEKILAETGVGRVDVTVRNLTGWARAKPPQGTVELWLHIG
jgi:type II secretory pathway component PulJ